MFHKDEDYAAFVRLVGLASERLAMRVLGYCVMPNHFHLVVWPMADGDLSRWMQWLMTAHVRRYHSHYHGSGHVWQGRFKAFPIQQDEHLLRVLRYVERNPLRAKLATSAEDWPWSSASSPEAAGERIALHPSPVDRGRSWRKRLNEDVAGDSDLTDVRASIQRGTPLGDERWKKRIAKRLGLESSLRPRGRPRKVNPAT